MKINKISPQGYCGGVSNALHQIESVLNDSSTPKPIYMLGSVIHNAYVISKLQEKGLILIEDKTKKRIELLDEIESGTVIFSAHGVSKAVYQKAQLKNLHIIDTTCPKVAIIAKQMEHHLNSGYTCAYIGMKHHPECEGILGISDSIILIETTKDIKKLPLNKSLYITNQTTLSILDTKEIYDEIKLKFPRAILDNKICNATSVRQEAISNQEKVDLCIIVGDIHSSNAKKLVLAGKNAKINTILVESVKDLQSIDLTNIESVSISSGASTPNELVDE
ncbi:MAG: 4-hydroxy-3-methylbut-2-enyl diphosphate reductase, partial [Anaeroplasmataceae bacterium]|nr:4-hydroxy-3-methylbut-2-enyl diphosphate reductase [Anaeroplasmataceae bacterium]